MSKCPYTILAMGAPNYLYYRLKYPKAWKKMYEIAYKRWEKDKVWAIRKIAKGRK